MLTATTQPSPTTSTGSSGGVIIIPDDEPDEKTWFEKNPVVTAIIAVAVLLILIIVILFYFIRKKRKAATSKDVDLHETESQSAAPPNNTGDNSPENIFPESFVIMTSPRMHQKRKSTLAVPPAFSVSNKRKSAPSVPVGWARWSTGGLEIHTSPTPGERDNNPMPKGYARKKRQSMPGIMMAVPVVYRGRAVSHGQRRNTYVPEHTSSTQRPTTP